MDFLKWYRNIIETAKPEPPEKAWNNIRDQLDIDSSWEKINSRLNRDRFISRMRIISAASALVLIVSASTWLLLRTGDPDNVTETENIAATNRPQIDTAGANEKEQEQVDTLVRDNEAAVNTATTLSPNKETDKPVNKLAEADNTGIITTEEKTGLFVPDIRIEKIEALPSGLAHYKEQSPDYIMPQENSHDNNIIKRKGGAFKKFYIGSTGQLANTWLINQKTISGFKSTSLVSTNPSFGSDFGIYAGTGLTDNIDLQMDLNILAQNRQEYNEYINGDYVTSNIQLNYTRLGLSLRYFINSGSFMQGEHALNMGPYIAYLHNASQDIDSETIYISGNYKAMDYGLQAGYEYVFPLSGSLGMGTGFRALYGLNNIYAGNERIPDYLNVTNNASVNITLSLKYLLSK